MILNRIIIIIIGLLYMSNANAEENFITLYDAKEVEKRITALSHDTLVLFDIDETLFTPASNSFRFKHPNDINLIDQIKTNKDLYPDFVAILSNWRKTRKTILVDPRWPEIIDHLQKKYQVFALTKMDTGRFGVIDSMEEWRYNELLSFNIRFSHLENMPNHMPNYYKGIFMTGAKKKSDILADYLPILKPRKIVFIDDRMDYLQDVANFCKIHQIQLTAIYYRQIEKIPGDIAPEITKFQMDYLVKNKIWLEDEAAEKLFKQLKT